MSITIESGIEAPTHGSGRPSIYPFRNMKVGDSFFVKSAIANADAVRSSCSQFGRRNKGFKFTTRADGNGTRVWRVNGGS